VKVIYKQATKQATAKNGITVISIHVIGFQMS